MYNTYASCKFKLICMKTLTKEIIVIIIVVSMIIMVAFFSYSYGKHSNTIKNDTIFTKIDTIKILYTSKYGDKIIYNSINNNQVYWVENEVGAIKQLSVK